MTTEIEKRSLSDHEYALKVIAVMLGMFPQQPHDPKVYIEEAVRLCVGRPKALVSRLVDPVHGLIAGKEFIPSVGEIGEWFDHYEHPKDSPWAAITKPPTVYPKLESVIPGSETQRRSPKAQAALKLMEKISEKHRDSIGDNYLPSVKRNSPQWKAWRKWRLEHDLGVAFMDKQDNWTVCSEWPPQ